MELKTLDFSKIATIENDEDAFYINVYLPDKIIPHSELDGELVPAVAKVLFNRDASLTMCMYTLQCIGNEESIAIEAGLSLAIEASDLPDDTNPNDMRLEDVSAVFNEVREVAHRIEVISVNLELEDGDTYTVDVSVEANSGLAAAYAFQSVTNDVLIEKMIDKYNEDFDLLEEQKELEK